jgi:Toprim-like
MEDNQFSDAVKRVIEATQNFLDTDAAYGPTDVRTRSKKERLAEAMGTLTPTNVDLPALHVVSDDERAEQAFRPPVADPQRWPQVRAYLTQGCELPGLWIDSLHDQGNIYADLRGGVVFIGENAQGVPTAAYLRGLGAEHTTLEPGTRRDPGWFTARLPAENEGGRSVLILAESPVDALSVLEMHRRVHRDRPDGKGERGVVTVMATEGAGPLPHHAIRETLNSGGMVRVATDNTPVGELIWQQLHEQYPLGPVDRWRPSMKDWNETLRFHNACYRDPTAADRQLDEVQRENPPDAQSREAVREAVRRLGPARHRDRDGWER